MMTLRKKVVKGRTYYQAWENGMMVMHLGTIENIAECVGLVRRERS